jgi:hypothetical protein
MTLAYKPKSFELFLVAQQPAKQYHVQEQVFQQIYLSRETIWRRGNKTTNHKSVIRPHCGSRAPWHLNDHLAARRTADSLAMHCIITQAIHSPLSVSSRALQPCIGYRIESGQQGFGASSPHLPGQQPWYALHSIRAMRSPPNPEEGRRRRISEFRWGWQHRGWSRGPHLLL